MNKTLLTEDELTALQRKIVSEGWFPIKEAFGHLEYFSIYEIGGTKYQLHYKSLMEETKGYIIE